MKVIKIRAWDDVEKRFWTFLSVGEKSGEGSVQFFGNEEDELEIGRLEEFDTGMGINDEFTPFPKHLYTGLKEKNRVEIYEGDIFFDDHNEEFGQVIFDEGKFLYETTTFVTDLFEIADALELRGNIYENPELLEEKI